MEKENHLKNHKCFLVTFWQQKVTNKNFSDEY